MCSGPRRRASSSAAPTRAQPRRGPPDRACGGGYAAAVTEHEPPRTEPARTSARRVAALLALLEALVLLGFVGFYVYEMATGATDDLTRAITSGTLILVFGIFLLALARAWARRSDWARTPTLLWNALLLPVAWSLHQSGQTWLAVAVTAVAVASIGAALAVPPRGPVGRAEDAGQGEKEQRP